MRKRKLFVYSSLVIIFIATCFDCFARAGGSYGSGMGFWKIIIFLFLLPIVLVYAAIMGIIISRKKSKARKLAEKLEITDPVWNNRNMTARAEDVFMKVQQAWMEKD